MLATTEAQPRTTTPLSHRLHLLHPHLRCREPFRRRLLKRSLDHDHPWTPRVHRRQHHPKETRPCLMEETTILIATTRPANHRLLPLALSPLRESPSSQRMIARMTCTRLLRHGDQSSVHRHHHLVRLNNRRQCFQCHSQAFLHGRHQGNPSMYLGPL
jgi:hypothetical protein